MNAVTAPATASALAERVLIKGDLAGLTQADRMNYYQQVCHSLGLNPLTRPFEFVTLSGKLTFYARKDATDQLRRVHGISTKIVSRTMEDDIMVVHAAASDKEGRQDEDYGAVYIGALKGEARANAVMKAITKAKRRVTLSICGLGWLDETEVADLPADVAAPADIDPQTGELPPRQIDQERPAPQPVNDEPAKLLGREAASRGKAILKVWTAGLDRELRARLKPWIMRELMPIAEAVDATANDPGANNDAGA